MNLNALRSIVSGNIQAIDQGMSLISSLSDHQYRQVTSPHVMSSIGQHFRHVVDMFLAVTNSGDTGIVDYDRRRRGADIEVDRSAAVRELGVIKHWMQDCLRRLEEDPRVLQCAVRIKTEVTLEETNSVEMPSTLLRELAFTSSHAVHHYSLISVIAKLQGVSVHDNFGVAPATATFLRGGRGRVDDPQPCAQ